MAGSAANFPLPEKVLLAGEAGFLCKHLFCCVNHLFQTYDLCQVEFGKNVHTKYNSSMRKQFLKVLLLLCLSYSTQAAQLTWQALEAPVRNFLQGELKGRTATYKLGRPASSLRLPECPALALNWPPGVPLSGPTYVEVSCPSSGWNVRYPVNIDERKLGVMTTRRLQPGEIVTAADVRLTELPGSDLGGNVLGGLDDVVGKVARNGLPAGTWVRNFMVQAPVVVRANQVVQVIAEDSGFRVLADGVAMNNAAVGENVSVRMPAGRMVRGTARADGGVAVHF